MVDWLKSLWNDLSILKKLYIVVGTLALLTLVELLSLHFAVNTLSSFRAFVSGEGLWTKAQKNAAYQLQRYALTRDEKDYEAFLRAFEVPEGDNLARVELLSKSPDLNNVRSGLLTGGIHPDDIDGIIKLFQRFSWLEHFAKAVDAWIEADKLIFQFKQLGIEYHSLISSGSPDELRLNMILDHINKLNMQLDIIESQFSNDLGKASRMLERFVVVVLLSLVLIVGSVGLGLTYLTGRKFSKGIFNLNKFAEKIGKGQFGEILEVKSKDEIGLLTSAVNKMSLLLEKSYNELMDSHRNLENKIEQRTSELAEIAVEKDRLYEEAKLAVKMRDDFLSVASHELRTPIAALLLNLQLLERYTVKDLNADNITNIKSHLKGAIQISKKLSSLNAVLLDLTRISLGKMELKLIDGDLFSTVQEVVTQLSLESAINGSLLKLHGTSKIMATFDPVRIGQVVTNLLSNAIKYGDGKEIDISVENKGNKAFIKVKDYGHGIPPEYQNKIFERFERATNDYVTGLGLGLFISKQIVEAHKGNLTVESFEGKGSTFTVELTVS